MRPGDARRRLIPLDRIGGFFRPDERLNGAGFDVFVRLVALNRQGSAARWCGEERGNHRVAGGSLQAEKLGGIGRDVTGSSRNRIPGWPAVPVWVVGTTTGRSGHLISVTPGRRIRNMHGGTHRAQSRPVLRARRFALSGSVTPVTPA